MRRNATERGINLLLRYENLRLNFAISKRTQKPWENVHFQKEGLPIICLKRNWRALKAIRGL